MNYITGNIIGNIIGNMIGDKYNANKSNVNNIDQLFLLIDSIDENLHLDIKLFATKLVENTQKQSICDNNIHKFAKDKYALTDPILTGIRQFVLDPSFPSDNNFDCALERASLLGAFNYNDEHTMIKNVIDACIITNPSPLCVATCVVISLLVNEIISNKNNITIDMIPTIFRSIMSKIKNITRVYCDIVNNRILKLYHDCDDDISEIKNNIEIRYNEKFNANQIINSIEKYMSIIFEDKPILHTLNSVECAFIALKMIINGNSFETIFNTLHEQIGIDYVNFRIIGSIIGTYKKCLDINQYLKDMTYDVSKKLRSMYELIK